MEGDGGQHNGKANDLERDTWLRGQGFRILRFWNHDIRMRTDAVLNLIHETLNESR